MKTNIHYINPEELANDESGGKVIDLAIGPDTEIVDIVPGHGVLGLVTKSAAEDFSAHDKIRTFLLVRPTATIETDPAKDYTYLGSGAVFLDVDYYNENSADEETVYMVFEVTDW